MKQEDLKIGGVYKHCEYPLFVTCTAIGKCGGLEGIALYGYNGIEQFYVSDSWFINNFEPFDIGLSLDQNKFEAVTKADNLNYWRKVGEELPENEDSVIVKIKVNSDTYYMISLKKLFTQNHIVSIVALRTAAMLLNGNQ